MHLFGIEKNCLHYQPGNDLASNFALVFLGQIFVTRMNFILTCIVFLLWLFDANSSLFTFTSESSMIGINLVSNVYIVQFRPPAAFKSVINIIELELEHRIIYSANDFLLPFHAHHFCPVFSFTGAMWIVFKMFSVLNKDFYFIS